MADSYWERANRRLSRRRLVRGGVVAGAGVAALAAVGCGDDDDDGGTTPAASNTASSGGSAAAGQPKKGGTYLYPQVGTYKDVFDPHTSLFQAAFFFSLIGNLALRPSVDATKIEPELVEKWEMPGDGTEITLTLRQGVTWHNKPPTSGRAFTAEDLAFNLTRITGKLNPDKLASFQRASTLPNFDSANPVDDKTVKVKLTKPHSGFLWGMSDWRNTIIPKDFVEKGGDFKDASSLIGTGAFAIESFQDAVKATFKANPAFWEKGKPTSRGWTGSSTATRFHRRRASPRATLTTSRAAARRRTTPSRS